MSQAATIRHSPIRFFLFTLLLFIILFLRKPDSLLNPQFFAEDGKVFYAAQLVFGWPAILAPYNGYLSLITRLAAAAESLFPAAIAPLLCSVIGLAVQAASYAVFILPACRYLIRSDALRIGAALVLATSLDGSEMIGNSLNCQWHVALPGLILLFLPNEGMAWGRRAAVWDAVITGSIVLIALSASILVIAMPFSMFRAVSRTGRERLIAAAFTLGFLVQICCFVATSPVLHTGGTTGPRGIAAAAFAFVAWLYRVLFTEFLGKALTVHLSNAVGNAGVAVAFFTVVAAGVFAFRRAGKEQRIALAIACYFTVSSILVTLATRSLLQFFSPGHVRMFEAARYFTLSIYVLVYAAAGVLDSFRSKFPESAKAAALCSIFAVGIISNFRVAAYPDLHWATNASAIDQWQADKKQGRPNPGVLALISPEPWAVDLPPLGARPKQ